MIRTLRTDVYRTLDKAMDDVREFIHVFLVETKSTRKNPFRFDADFFWVENDTVLVQSSGETFPLRLYGNDKTVAFFEEAYY